MSFHELYWSSRRGYEILRIFHRVRGMEEVQKITSFYFDFHTVRFLKSIGYRFDKQNIMKSRGLYEDSIYALICFNILKYEDLNATQKQDFEKYVSEKDVKACKQIYPFMKGIRKRKIMTFLCCVRKLYPLLQKEIIWNIIDTAYSPKEQRGSF